MVTDGTISIFAAIVLFCIPSAPRRVTGPEKINLANKENFKDRILDEEDIKRVSWDIVLLLAGKDPRLPNMVILRVTDVLVG
jgi:hypothetical protein